MSNGKKLVIAVSGKGGVGKTTITALMLRALIDMGIKSILVVDADPASNLPEVLGIDVQKTVGDITNELKKAIDKGELPPLMSKRDILEFKVLEVLKELPQFDLLVMGRTEGEGCYCMVNDVLTNILDTLSRNYAITLMDMEAGLEHLSRRTDRDVDYMVIVTDLSRMGFLTALRIKKLAKEVHIQFKRTFLVGNRFPQDKEDLIYKYAEEIGVEPLGIIPHDENIARFNLEGTPLLKLPANSPALMAIKDIVKKMGLVP
ncbi:MAG: AAA family ATPase [Candidatus Nezhaarchaeota archaeon]|nr:AAA family ATPase [Candidatus Nezhaarchaeota archaeon]MCX8142340.1 AAA family ATPase [Candidatus Nezhaarchaeota archaeon]MDW8050687.1 AAA family ATPase [Nitrososphaerota archaeon]